ncbi:MAG: hypothetical protein IJ252_08500 [Solobacterium sp.]|nr:hypothetical protein [Solobacterium sp.]
MITVRQYRREDLGQMIEIWNEVVAEGIAFPQTEFLDLQSGETFFKGQTYTGVAEEDSAILGLYLTGKKTPSIVLKLGRG